MVVGAPDVDDCGRNRARTCSGDRRCRKRNRCTGRCRAGRRDPSRRRRRSNGTTWRRSARIEWPCFSSSIDATGDQAGVVERLLGEPDVEMHAELVRDRRGSRPVARTTHADGHRPSPSPSSSLALAISASRCCSRCCLASSSARSAGGRPGMPASTAAAVAHILGRRGRPSSAVPCRARSRPDRRWAGKARLTPKRSR